MIVIDKQKVLAFGMKRIRARVSPNYFQRFSKMTGEHYRFLAWLSHQFNNVKILDLGTRAGGSALCLADNTTNEVLSMDISDEMKRENNFDFFNVNNIKFVLDDATKLPPAFFDPFTIILLDIDHSGKSERIVLDNLYQSNFKGLLIMDDIDFYKFKDLHEVWRSIKKTKTILEFAHHSGTGLISFGLPLGYV